MLKRLIDIVGGVAGCLITAFLYPFIALAIKLDSAGPVLYRQIRVGYRGREFYCYKFRTRTHDADVQQLQSHAEIAANKPYRHDPNDPFVTRVGRFLRKTSINELPQFYNVLRNDMSLVGPRPTLVVDIKYFAYRQAVKPGITGLWQISGRADLGEKEGVILDQKYIAEQSPLFDLWILWKTIRVVLYRKGAT